MEKTAKQSFRGPGYGYTPKKRTADACHARGTYMINGRPWGRAATFQEATILAYQQLLSGRDITLTFALSAFMNHASFPCEVTRVIIHTSLYTYTFSPGCQEKNRPNWNFNTEGLSLLRLRACLSTSYEAWGRTFLLMVNIMFSSCHTISSGSLK
jgi:hypothetical protein